MQLVAASKMRQFQKRAVNARDYVTDLLHVLDTNIKSQDLSVYTEKRTEGATLFVLYTSDKGLCGPLNTKLINSLFKSNRWNDLPEDKRKLITIGKKSFEYAKNNDIKLKKHYVQVPEKLTAMDSLKVVDGILKTWKTEKIKEVIFIAPHYKNSFTFYPVMKQFLPFTEETITSTLGPINEDKKTKKEKNNNHYMIFNPSEEHVLNRLYEQMIQGLFIQSFLELKASEYSSRMIAMQNATDSADRMIEDLSRVFNKARQAVITNEIAELMGGTAAVTD